MEKVVKTIDGNGERRVPKLKTIRPYVVDRRPAPSHSLDPLSISISLNGVLIAL